MERVKIDFMGIKVDNLTFHETVNIIDESVTKGEKIHHVAINAFIITLLQKNQAVKDSIVNGNLINADGQAIVWGSKILGRPIKERVTGIDLMEALVEQAACKGRKIYLFGAQQDVVVKVADKYSTLYGDPIIAGYRNGYYKAEEEEDLVKNISNSGATYLFVAMGSPQKELFLYKYREALNLPFIMSVGGSFDVIAGKIKRAPQWMQRTGIEWLFRVLQEPRRLWKRYLTTNTEFIFIIFKEFMHKIF